MTGAAARQNRRAGNPEQRRQHIRARLLKAIEELPALGEAYTTITVERLATAAGLSRATFYTYFDGKGDLLQACFAETIEEFKQACAAWHGLGPASSQADIGFALARIIDTYRAHAALMTAINHESTQDSALRAQINDVVELGIDALRQHIEKGQEQGWVDPDLLPAETAAWLTWMLERGLSLLATEDWDDQAAALKDNLTNMAWHVLYAGSRAPR